MLASIGSREGNHWDVVSSLWTSGMWTQIAQKEVGSCTDLPQSSITCVCVCVCVCV